MNASRAKQKGPGRPRQPIMREKLLSAAGEVFSQYGYEGASLSQIAEAVGIQKASLYHHYPSKLALYLAILDATLVELLQLLVEIQNAEDDFVTRLERLITNLVEYFGGHPDTAQLLAHELAGSGTYFHTRGYETVIETLNVSTAFFAAGMNAKVFRQCDPKHLTLSTGSMILFYFAAVEPSSRLLGSNIFTPAMVEQRRLELLAQCQAMCLVKPCV